MPNFMINQKSYISTVPETFPGSGPDRRNAERECDILLDEDPQHHVRFQKE